MPATSPKSVKTVALCPGHLAISLVSYGGKKRSTNIQPDGTRFYAFERLPARYTTMNELEVFFREGFQFVKQHGGFSDVPTEADAPRLVDYLRGMNS